MGASGPKNRQYCSYVEVYEETNSIGVVDTRSNCDNRRDDSKRFQQSWLPVRFLAHARPPNSRTGRYPVGKWDTE
jgi:hypothetical protein